ncbi:hypothetical protein HYS93_02400 [Candidatus Daviesbacteria bacterium]|nr:hypothetical protein [Candidatus Daviesbacteria bacterium]
MSNGREPVEKRGSSNHYIELARFMWALLAGKNEDKMLVLAARASVVGGVSTGAAIVGFATGRLEIAALGGSLTYLSGYIGLRAVNASKNQG